jgi:hypothetical protein
VNEHDRTTNARVRVFELQIVYSNFSHCTIVRQD